MEDVGRWLDALIDARGSLQSLIALCSDASRDELAGADAQLADAADRLLGRNIALQEGPETDPDFFAISADVRAVVVRCARRDLRPSR
jgi:hypothetical protein